MSLGYFCLVLHAHLPFVRHPEYEDSLEERWFYEAMTETYLPLLKVFEGLAREGIPFRVTMTMSPTLVAMMSDPLLQNRYAKHLENLIELAGYEEARTRPLPQFHATARMYQRKFEECRKLFEDDHHRNILNGFKALQDHGLLEIITCSGTHIFAPLYQTQQNVVRAQVAAAVQSYETAFGRAPRGIWNAECGYFPGLDRILRDMGLRLFFTDAHGILLADRRPRYGVFAPLYCPSGVAAFGRDLESSKSVWSAEEGYPGDPAYREFYRDIGYDLDLDYVRPYIHESGLRVSTGIKYYRVTGRVDLSDKQPYDPYVARERAASHAGNFLFNREHQVRHLASFLDRPPMIISPYDAELFGHWWYEGPEFIDFLFRKMHYDQDTVEPLTPSEYLERHPRNQVATPSMSSWGNKGYCEVWLEGSNDWIYRHLHKAGERMIELANRYHGFLIPDPLTRRALNQAARELLLAQSSDWAFIMKTGTMVEYAVQRTKEHLNNFTDLYEMISRNDVYERRVSELETNHNIFPDLNYGIYADVD
ncbi:MAG: DUF1957 domain-containing protein [Candidatus Sumerlaeota bacterium]|nr:DUF1957 domain-containing protein [Candidatus Sumerlaeota bacterium]